MERKELLAMAASLGLGVPKNIGTEKLKKMIDDLDNGEEVITGDLEKRLETSRQEMLVQMQEEYDKKLEEKIQELSDNMEINATRQSNYMPMPSSKAKMIRDARQLVRCIITNRNPMKSAWEGEIISAGNDIGVNEKKYVPFNLENGYHLPRIIVNALNDKKCTIFINKKGADGKLIQEGKLIKEYAIEELEPLTKEEFKELGDDQRARGVIDNN